MKPDTERLRKVVYEIVRAIPRGRVLTYGIIAHLTGWPNHARLVGHIMKGAGIEPNLPCHRVLAASGRPSPTFPEQRALLEAEGVRFKDNGCVDMKRYLWEIVGKL